MDFCFFDGRFYPHRYRPAKRIFFMDFLRFSDVKNAKNESGAGVLCQISFVFATFALHYKHFIWQSPCYASRGRSKETIGRVTILSIVPSKTAFAASSCPSPIISEKFSTMDAIGQAQVMKNVSLIS